ncbi:carboxymuconolactone decarboxylase family protein [Amycolatopsis sp. NPDC059021]|uniref:carboxymuconolactone decarboxylase family protein n=1 Tax=Amycolatopsis sp. NPDC059021 TaxID=3346704 RepID=UPI00366F8492
MPHIPVDENLPGIVGLLAFRPETAAPLNQLAEVLLRGPSSLTVGERELIAAVVSRANECQFCARSHAAVAAEALDGGTPMVDAACQDVDQAPVSPKIRALLKIALATRESGRAVTGELVAAARAQGATDTEIHDTVLIAAAFCLYNRYVDGLGAVTPDNSELYRQMGVRLLADGYLGIGAGS